ncbi:hypothetical protein K474DRAFT_1408378 [Panus rudis PR-1116 ss-1]|nr:hypothetical protein K474DRAFT_1408378 [Panus rudis PR-1116 ss-1]
MPAERMRPRHRQTCRVWRCSILIMRLGLLCNPAWVSIVGHAQDDRAAVIQFHFIPGAHFARGRRDRRLHEGSRKGVGLGSSCRQPLYDCTPYNRI